MPLEWNAESVTQSFEYGFRSRPMKRGVGHESGDVVTEIDVSVNLRLHVVVKNPTHRRFGLSGEVLEQANKKPIHAGTVSTEGGTRLRDIVKQGREYGLEMTDRTELLETRVTIAIEKRTALQRSGSQYQVAGSESRCGTVGVGKECERTVLRPLRIGAAIVRATKEPLFPAITVAAGKRGRTTAGDLGLELAPVATVVQQALCYGETVGSPSIRVEGEVNLRRTSNGRLDFCQPGLGYAVIRESHQHSRTTLKSSGIGSNEVPRLCLRFCQ